MQSSSEITSQLKSKDDKPTIATNLLALKSALAKSSTGVTKDTAGSLIEYCDLSPLIKIMKNTDDQESVYINLAGYKGCTVDDIHNLMSVIKTITKHTILDLTETNLNLTEATTLVDSLKDKFACELEIIIDNGYSDGFPGNYEEIYSPYIYQAFIQAIKHGESKHWPDNLKLHIPVFEPLISAITTGLESGIFPKNFALNINNNSWYPASISESQEKRLMKAIMSTKCPSGVSINPHYFQYHKTFFNRESFDLTHVISNSKGVRLDISELDLEIADKITLAFASKK